MPTRPNQRRLPARDKVSWPELQLAALRAEPADDELTAEDMCPDGIHPRNSGWTASKPRYSCNAQPQQEILRKAADIFFAAQRGSPAQPALPLVCHNLGSRSRHSDPARRETSWTGRWQG